MESQFVFLGTGSSMGVPVIGCKCSVCTSLDPKNQRMRAGVLLKIGDKQILIDAGPDVRRQALLHKIDRIDGFILTHAHYDHIAGFDDIKAYRQGEKKVPCLMLDETLEELKIRYHYLIRPLPEDSLNSPFFTWQLLKNGGGKTLFEEVPLTIVTYMQSGMKVLGVRVGNLAYISDIKEYKKEIFEALKGVEILIVSALKEGGSNMHFSVGEALDFSKAVRAKTTYLTHIAHEMCHEKAQALLPSDVFLAYDGLSISFQSDI